MKLSRAIIFFSLYLLFTNSNANEKTIIINNSELLENFPELVHFPKTIDEYAKLINDNNLETSFDSPKLKKSVGKLLAEREIRSSYAKYLKFTYPKKGHRIDHFEENLSYCYSNLSNLPKLKK